MANPAQHLYVIALGSNRRHHRYGAPKKVLSASIAALRRCARIIKRSAVISSAPLGPSRRLFANAAMVIESALGPEDMLRALKGLEAEFGRNPRGQAWGERVLDLDIILWSGGTYFSAPLTIPHLSYRQRGFVLGPASAIAPDWRDPILGLSLKQLNARLTRARSLPRGSARSTALPLNRRLHVGP